MLPQHSLDVRAGKSSVLESLSGITLPRGQGTVTRCPLVLQLRSRDSLGPGGEVVALAVASGDGEAGPPQPKVSISYRTSRGVDVKKKLVSLGGE